MLTKRGKKPQWHYRFMIAGKIYSGSTGLRASARNRTAAEKQEAARRQAILTSGRDPGALRHVPFTEAAEKFLAWVRVEHRAKPETARRVAVSFASLGRFFGDRPVSDLGAADIEAYKSYRAETNLVRDITIRHDLHNLSKFFQYARKQRWARENPTELVRKPSDAEAIREYILSAAEEKVYFAAAAKQSRALFDIGRLMILQGCRPEELRSLRAGDVDAENRLLHIRGGKSKAARRALHLTDEALVLLAARLAAPNEHGWLFPSPRKAGAHIQRLNAQHDAACIEAGLAGFTMYDLRHSFATRFYAATHDLVVLAKILGHSNLRTVQRYVHLSEEYTRTAMLKYAETLKQPEVVM